MDEGPRLPCDSGRCWTSCGLPQVLLDAKLQQHVQHLREFHTSFAALDSDRDGVLSGGEWWPWWACAVVEGVSGGLGGHVQWWRG